MIKFGADYSKLKKNLKLASARLKLLQIKKSEQNEKLKSEIADYLKNGKYVLAKIRTRKILIEKKSVEAMELIKMYCDELLEKYELFEQRKQPDITLKRTISSLIWVAPYYQTHIAELDVIAKQLSIKYGSRFTMMALKNQEEIVDPELIKRVIVPIPSDETTEKCLKNIGLEYDIKCKKSEECVKGNFQDVQKSECEFSAAFNQDKENSILRCKDDALAENAVKKDDKKCKCKISTALNQDRSNSKLSSNDKDLAEDSGKKVDKISKKKSFRKLFRSKSSKRSKQHSDVIPSSETENLSDNVSGSVDFQVQEKQQIHQERSSSASQENRNKSLKCGFSFNDDNGKTNVATNIVSENCNGQYSLNDENLRENSFIPTAPPSLISEFQPITAYQLIYDQSPPSYESLYPNDVIDTNDLDQNLSKWFDLMHLPPCPDGNPGSKHLSEDTIEKKEKEI